MEDTNQHRGVKSRRECPRCNERLYIVERGGIQLDHCWDCGGVWFDRNELDELVDEDGTVELLIQITGELKGENLKCPDCREFMSTHEIFGVYLEQCRECKGIWMDRGETEKVWEMDERSKHPFGIGVEDPDPASFWNNFRVKYYGFEKVNE